MSIKRRDFLKTVGVGAVAAGIPLQLPGLATAASPSRQELHKDYISNGEGVEYFFLGNGHIQAVFQVCPGDAATHCGLLLMSPEHFGRKASTFLYHPERGLERTRLALTVDRKGYQPMPGQAKVSWTYPDSIPTIVVEWQAGACTVHEQLYCPAGMAAMIRTVTVKNAGSQSAEATAMLQLSPNFMFFDEFDVDREKKTLTAIGYHRLQLFSSGATAVGDRHIEAAFGAIAPGAERSVSFVMTLDLPREQFEKSAEQELRAATAAYWARTTRVDAHQPVLNHLFNTAQSGIRTAIAQSGKMDGGIWQYNQEWVRDQSMVAASASMTGLTDVAASILERIMTRSVDQTGKTVESSRTRPVETFEIDQNGELLYALWTHWMWSGSDALIRKYWAKVRLVADFILQPAFLDPSTGLVKNVREYWERDANFGVKEGFELTYQLWSIIGLDHAAAMARHMASGQDAARWHQAAARMRTSFLDDPRFSLVDEGHFIKRRLVSGHVQKTMEPPNRNSMPPGSPLQGEKISYCDPDAANVLPIVFEVIDPRSPLALETLKFVEKLWNQDWQGGGYGRYDWTSEPDSAGSWPFASMFIARAYLEAGNHEKAWRTLNWMAQAQGGRSGAWPEFYGDRRVPPLPPVGVVPWVWAELTAFIMHHLLGVRPSQDQLTIRPLLLTGVTSVNARISFRGSHFTLHVNKATGTPAATVNGGAVPVRNGKIEVPIPAPEADIVISI